MNEAHIVGDISFSGMMMRLRVDGKDYDVDVARQSPRLARATAEERGRFAVSPSGYGIHWPDIDEDLAIDGLIGIKHPFPCEEAPSPPNS